MKTKRKYFFKAKIFLKEASTSIHDSRANCCSNLPAMNSYEIVECLKKLFPNIKL